MVRPAGLTIRVLQNIMYLKQVPKNTAPRRFSHSIYHLVQLYQFSDQLKKVKPCHQYQNVRICENMQICLKSAISWRKKVIIFMMINFSCELLYADVVLALVLVIEYNLSTVFKYVYFYWRPKYLDTNDISTGTRILYQ